MEKSTQMALTLLDLNDDCLEHICEYLSLQGQIMVRNVCVRFEQIVRGLWRHKCKKVTALDAQLEFSLDRNKDFVSYLSTVSDCVEELHCGSIDAKLFRTLRGIRFPKVHTLHCDVRYREEGSNDEDTQLIAAMFPVLRNLTLSSAITGQYLWEMFTLTDLDLSCCENLDTQFFTRIFATLKLRRFTLFYYGYNTLLDDRLGAITRCETLEEISIDDHHLIQIIDEVLQMPNMRKLTSYTRDYDEFLSERFADAVGLRTHTTIFNNVLWSKDKHVESLIKMKNLRRLVINCDDIEISQMRALSENLHELREFYFMVGACDSEGGLLTFISQNDRLEVFDVQHTKINTAFLELAQAAVAKQVKRKVPLLFRCFGTDIAKEAPDYFQAANSSKNFKVSCEEFKIALPQSRSLQYEWTPLEPTEK